MAKRGLTWVPIILLTAASYYSCRQNAGREEVKEKVYSIYLPEFADDSIQVYTSQYESFCVSDVMRLFAFESVFNLTEEDIIKGEKLLKTKILDVFIEMGKYDYEHPESGEELFAYFSKKPLREYKRQYMGVMDKKKRRYILVTLWNMDLTYDDLETYYNDKMFCPIPAIDEYTYREVFIIDFKREEVRTSNVSRFRDKKW